MPKEYIEREKSHGMKGALNPIEEKPYCSYGERKDGADK